MHYLHRQNKRSDWRYLSWREATVTHGSLIFKDDGKELVRMCDLGRRGSSARAWIGAAHVQRFQTRRSLEGRGGNAVPWYGVDGTGSRAGVFDVLIDTSAGALPHPDTRRDKYVIVARAVSLHQTCNWIRKQVLQECQRRMRNNVVGSRIFVQRTNFAWMFYESFVLSIYFWEQISDISFCIRNVVGDFVHINEKDCHFVLCIKLSICNKLCGMPPQYAPAPCKWCLEEPPRSFTRLMTLTFDLLTLELMCNVTRDTDNLSPNFGASATFVYRVMGKHASKWRREISDLWGHRACRWRGSWYSNVYQVWSL